MPCRCRADPDGMYAHKKMAIGQNPMAILMFGRSDRIRTCDLCNPIAARYQAAPRSGFCRPVRDSPCETLRILPCSSINEKRFLRLFFQSLAKAYRCRCQAEPQTVIEARWRESVVPMPAGLSIRLGCYSHSSLINPRQISVTRIVPVRLRKKPARIID